MSELPQRFADTLIQVMPYDPLTLIYSYVTSGYTVGIYYDLIKGIPRILVEQTDLASIFQAETVAWIKLKSYPSIRARVFTTSIKNWERVLIALYGVDVAILPKEALTLNLSEKFRGKFTTIAFLDLTPKIVCLKGRQKELGSSLERAPIDYLYIGRKTSTASWRLPASKWHNPFTVRKYGREGALTRYREYIFNRPDLISSLPELGGRTLACWCAPAPCHGHILAELYRTIVKI